MASLRAITEHVQSLSDKLSSAPWKRMLKENFPPPAGAGNQFEIQSLGGGTSAGYSKISNGLFLLPEPSSS